MAVGRATHQWELVEHHLGQLFATLLGTMVPQGALRVYGLTTGFGTRQQMLTEAANAFFYWHPSTALAEQFRRIVKQIGDPAAARRNEIAHGIVISEQRLIKLPEHPVDEATVREIVRQHYFLVPSFHSARKRDFDMTPAYKYTSKDIEQFTGKYRLLADEIYRLGKSISDWRAKWSEKTPAP